MARYALVIGISEYQEPFDFLSKADTDAYAVKELLEKYGKYRVTLLTGSVTRTDLFNELKTFLQEQAVRSDALIYFTGHGFQKVDPLGADTSEGFLATSDCVVTVEDKQVTNVQQGGFSFEAFNKLIKEAKLRSLVVILDACHSGFFIERTLVNESLSSFNYKADYYLITACRGFEEALAKKREAYSVFTGALLDGLSAKNADKDGRITSDRLSDFIYGELERSKQEPLRMSNGRPILLMEYQLPIYPKTPSDSVTQAEIESLVDILQHGDISQNIKQAYNDCLPKPWLGIVATDNREILKNLNEEIPRREGKIPPLFDFISRLTASEQIPQIVLEKLRSWISEASQKYGINLTPLNFSSPSPARPYLLIRLKPSKNQTEQFFVKAWFILDDRADAGYSRFKPLDSEEYHEGPYTLDQIPKLLDYFLCQTLEKLAATEFKPVIEFFLPQDCLGAEVDVWEVLDVVNQPIRVGTEYQVVVRSYERLLPRYRKQAMNSWRQKWSKAKQLKPPLPQELFELLSKADGYNWSSLRASLVDKVGLKLTCPPISPLSSTPGVRGSQPNLITALLSTAIPIAIWPRCIVSESTLADTIESLLNEGPLFELPEFVRKKRLEAVQKQIQDHLGQHLVLLWEDPDRLPPDEENFEFQVS